MPITAAQRERRQKHIGSSDMAAILGVDPWRSSYDVWLDKTGQLPAIEENSAMYAGTRFESGVLEFAEHEFGKLTRNQYRSRPEIHLGANIDAVVNDTNMPVECKTAGLFYRLPDGWGDAGTDQVPDHHVIQAHVHMMCMNGSEPPMCHLAAFLGGRGFVSYAIPRNADICDVIETEAVKFWEHVESHTPPQTIPHLDVVKRTKRVPAKTIDLGGDVFAAWVDAKELAKDAKKASDDAQATLIAKLGDAEVGAIDGVGTVTFFSQTATRVDTDKLKADGLYDQYTKQTAHRVLRFKKDK